MKSKIEGEYTLYVQSLRSKRARGIARKNYRSKPEASMAALKAIPTLLKRFE